MTFIDVYRGDGCTRHLVDDRERELVGGDWRWTARTACGRDVKSRHSGECIAPMIDCGNCRRILRANGWQV